MSHCGICRGTRYSVFSVNYRMYPNAIFPQFIEDAIKSVSFIFRNIEKYDVNGEVYVPGQ